jgi:hypothetical protein
MRPALKSVFICGAFIMASIAQTPGHALIQDGMVTGVARDQVMQSSIKRGAKKKSKAQTARDDAEKKAVYTLIDQYTACKASARGLAPARRDAIRANCVKEYDAKFTKACVGAANTIGICKQLKNRGTIEW